MRYIVFLITAIFFFSCRSPNSSEKESTRYGANLSAIQVEGMTAANLSEIDSLATIQLIPLETNEKCLVSSISKILVNENFLYVLDENFNQVLLFKNNGEFVRKVGAIGRGPGEYLSVEDMAFNADTTSIFLVSNNSMKITEYGLDGTLKKDIFIDMCASKLAVDSLNNFYLFVNKNRSEKSQNYDLIKLRYDGSLVDRYFVFTDPDDHMISYAGFVTSGRDRDILFNNSFSDTVYTISEGHVTPKYVFASGNEGHFTTNKAFTEDLQQRNYLEIPFFELQDGFLFLFASDSRVRPIVSNYTKPDNHRVLPFPINRLVGYDKTDHIYAYVFPVWFNQDKDAPYMRRALEQFPVFGSVLEHSKFDDNPVIIKFSL